MVQNLLDNEKHMIENNDDMKQQQLPPGFRFDPTDDELVLHFLYSKLNYLSSSSSSPISHNNYNYNLIIPELEGFYDHYHPCQLHAGEAYESSGEWYFYTKKTDNNNNRVSENGYWKEMVDMDQPIVARNSNILVGFKKCLVFYDRKFPSSSAVETPWFMQEYHAFCNNNFGAPIIHHNKITRSKQPDVDKWVLCRVQQVCDEPHQWMTNIIHDQERYSDEVELSSSDEAVLLAMEDDDEEDEIMSYPY